MLFELPAIEGLVGDEQMAVEAPLHARLVQPLPPAGELSIALVLRRRALLGKLVAWARGRGRPFDVKPEPTPGHVRRAAADDFQTARWADAIERAVFGGGDVDARMEREIERMAPAGAATRGPAGRGPVTARPRKAARQQPAQGRRRLCGRDVKPRRRSSARRRERQKKTSDVDGPRERSL